MVLDGGGWLAPCPSPFTPGKRPGTHCTWGWLGPWAGLDSCRKSRPYWDLIPGLSSPYHVSILTTLSHIPYTVLSVFISFVSESFPTLSSRRFELKQHQTFNVVTYIFFWPTLHILVYFISLFAVSLADGDYSCVNNRWYLIDGHWWTLISNALGFTPVHAEGVYVSPSVNIYFALIFLVQKGMQILKMLSAYDLIWFSVSDFLQPSVQLNI